MSEMVIKNLSDGNEVAGAIEMYVNSFTTPGKKFYEYMLKTEGNVQHNFTMLCLEWFLALANVHSFDGRNEMSVELAKKISEELRYDVLSKRKMAAKGIPHEMTFDYRNDEAAVRLFENYLRLAESNEAFVNKMLHAHRTNQQSFSRMCVYWLLRLTELSSKRTTCIRLAKKVKKHCRYLPMI